MILKKKKGGYMGRFGGRKVKGGMIYTYNLKNNIKYSIV